MFDSGCAAFETGSRLFCRSRIFDRQFNWMKETKRKKTTSHYGWMTDERKKNTEREREREVYINLCDISNSSLRTSTISSHWKEVWLNVMHTIDKWVVLVFFSVWKEPFGLDQYKWFQVDAIPRVMTSIEERKIESLFQLRMVLKQTTFSLDSGRERERDD